MTVTGTPRLALSVAASTRQADYSYTSGRWLLFLYVTQAVDSDTDKVVSTPGALTFTTMTWATAQIVMVAAWRIGTHRTIRPRWGIL